MTKAFSLLIAIQLQIVALILFAVFGADYLNEHYPQDFNWLLVTFVVAGIAIVQTVYVVIKVAMRDERQRRKK